MFISPWLKIRKAKQIDKKIPSDAAALIIRVHFSDRDMSDIRSVNSLMTIII